jgi:hypothetical protein
VRGKYYRKTNSYSLLEYHDMLSQVQEGWVLGSTGPLLSTPHRQPLDSSNSWHVGFTSKSVRHCEIIACLRLRVRAIARTIEEATGACGLVHRFFQTKKVCCPVSSLDGWISSFSFPEPPLQLTAVSWQLKGYRTVAAGRECFQATGGMTSAVFRDERTV